MEREGDVQRATSSLSSITAAMFGSDPPHARPDRTRSWPELGPRVHARRPSPFPSLPCPRFLSTQAESLNRMLTEHTRPWCAVNSSHLPVHMRIRRASITRYVMRGQAAHAVGHARFLCTWGTIRIYSCMGDPMAASPGFTFCCGQTTLRSADAASRPALAATAWGQ